MLCTKREVLSLDVWYLVIIFGDANNILMCVEWTQNHHFQNFSAQGSL